MESSIKMVIFSDIHFLDRKYEWSGNRKLTEYSKILVDKTINTVDNTIKPDVCIHLGDLIQDTKNHEDDLKNLKTIWNQLQNFKTPFYTLIGNHDLKMMTSRNEVLKILDYEKGSFSVNINGYHLILLGTDVNNDICNENGGIYKTQYLPDEDIKWLENDLEENKDLKCIIFSHFGIAEDNMNGNYWFENDPESAMLKNRKEIKNIINKYNNILAVFCGHQHWTKNIVENNIPYYIVGSLIENINNDGVPDGVYYIVETENSKMKVTEKHIKL